MTRVLILAGFAASLRNFRGPLIEAFLERNLEVHAAAPGLLADATTRDWLTERGVVVHDVPLQRAGLSVAKDLRTVGALTALMRRIRPDHFIGYTVKPVIWGLIAARRSGVPNRVALITGLGYAFSGEDRGRRALTSKLVKALYRHALRRATLVFFQNPDDRSDFDRFGLLPRGVPVEIVNGSGVDLSRFPKQPIPPGPVRFLLIARLLGDKGIREYVAAARELRPHWPDAQWHLVGGIDPNPSAISRSEAQGWHESGDVIWHGALPDVRDSLAGSHVYVLPSYREGTPRTVLEAMATGRAIVTTDAPGCRQTVEDGRNGVLVPVRDVAALRDAMQEFLDDPALIATMGEESRRMAEEIYDVHKVNASMLGAMGL